MKYNKLILKARAVLFWVPAFFVTIPFMVLVNFLVVVPYKRRYRIMRIWNYIVLWWLKVTCGLTFKVVGAENIQDYPVVVMAKHQSTYETVALTTVFPPMSWVVKKELLKIPVFGWALFMMHPIAIDRKAGRKAVTQIVEQGKKRFEDGISIMLFPEGTRAKPGQTLRYKKGGFILAEKIKADILPIAHNAGDFWPKHSLIKWPGEITISIGAIIKNEGLNSGELKEKTEQWIETEVARLHVPNRFPY